MEGEQAAYQQGLGGEVADVGVEEDGALDARCEVFPVAGGPGEERVGGVGEPFEIGDAVAFEDRVGPGEAVAGGVGMAERGGGRG
ncbi:hypothetical protein ACFY7H_00810 [Streptomyces sp. NPDC012794]|uniref:hypothetical protein n=1 Tax=Streptomyces sp. NPDC012794 TaxID=3364850 RepID=UPI00367B0147